MCLDLYEYFSGHVFIYGVRSNRSHIILDYRVKMDIIYSVEVVH